MNTVMDDNKMLTLASNERIPLTPTMRLLLEINHMNHCSPATVSRGGVIFVNAEDVGWKPAVDSWIEKLEVCWVCSPQPDAHARSLPWQRCRKPVSLVRGGSAVHPYGLCVLILQCSVGPCRLRSTGPC
jgi:hypothetical protein